MTNKELNERLEAAIRDIELLKRLIDALTARLREVEDDLNTMERPK